MTSSRPRVLFVTTRFPYPGDRGDRLYALQTLRVLASRYDVTVAAFSDDGAADREGGRILAGWGVRTVTAPLPIAGRLVRLAMALLSGRPLQVAYYDEPALRARLRGLADSEPPFDAVVCHLIRSVPLAREVRARMRVLALCDSLTLGLERRLAHAPLLERPSIVLEVARVRRYEATVLEGFDEGWLVSEVDRAAFGAAAGKVVVLPLGVDEALLAGAPAPEPPPVLGFLGHLGVPHNVDAAIVLARQVLPALRARGVECRVRLIGADPAPAVRALARLPGVELAGYVPDLASALRDLRVMCAPLRFSSGVQFKLIEAAAAGVPVVSSAAAVEALGSGARAWFGTGDDPASWAAAIEAVWSRTPEVRERIAGARAWVGERFRWNTYAERMALLLARSDSGGALEPASSIDRD